ncbi:MAG: glycosyl hydrolase [Nitrososphaera sp.]
MHPWPGAPFAAIRSAGHSPDMRWRAINTGNGVYDWQHLDGLITVSLLHGVDIVYTFMATPLWASTNPTGTGCAFGDGTCYAPTAQSWEDFVTAITARYAGKIKYWELWNEPDALNFWSGTTPELVTMAEAAYPIIKAAHPDNVVLSPSPQGPNAHLWIDKYFSSGGVPYTDAISFHGYLYGAPEIIGSLIANVRAIQAKYSSLSGKPIWDTEHSFFGSLEWDVDEDRRAAWVARFLVLSAAAGIDRSFWYSWYGFDVGLNAGMLYNLSQQKLLKPGMAYIEAHSWLVNAVIGAPTFSQGVHQVRVTRGGGYEALIVWASDPNPEFTALFVVPAQYTRYRTLDAATIPVVAGSTLMLTMKPIILEYDPA